MNYSDHRFQKLIATKRSVSSCNNVIMLQTVLSAYKQALKVGDFQDIILHQAEIILYEKRLNRLKRGNS